MQRKRVWNKALFREIQAYICKCNEAIDKTHRETTDEEKRRVKEGDIEKGRRGGGIGKVRKQQPDIKS